jgi:hypothetical protein
MKLRIPATVGLYCLLPVSTLLVAQSEAPPSPAAAQTEQPVQRDLIGRLENEKTYIAPHDTFRVEVPVLPELGGTITDTENVVTFQDAFTVHASVACFAMDATLRWEDETRGRKDFLTYFFANFVLPDFEHRFPGSSVESAKFRPSLRDGTLMTFMLLPNGTMFSDRLIVGTEEKPPVAKRSNWLFVKNEHVFIVSMELAERVLEHSTWDKTPAEEDAILTRRLEDFISKISFPPAAVPAK